MKEIWKDIDGYNGIYKVSNLGRIKSNGFEYLQKGKGGNVFRRKSQPKILSQSYTVEGYLVVTLIKNGIAKQHKVHRIIADAFIPNPDKKPVINHINGQKDDNRIENLEWCTVKENTEHAHSTGLCGRNAKAKCVARVDESGKILEVFESALQAAKHFGHYSSASNLHKVCRNGRGKWCGHMFRYISLSEYESFKAN